MPAAALPTKENLQIRQQTSSLPTGDPQAPTAPPSAATPEVLWRLSYTRRHPSYKAGAGGDTIGIALHEDVVLGPVMDEWETILGKQEIAEKGLNFLMFEDRNAAADEGNELDFELGQD